MDAFLSGPSVAPASGGKPRSIVILLHGYGSNGDDLIGLVPYWRDALPNTLFLSPNAPEPCPGAPGGRQWWDRAGPAPDASDAREQRVRGPAPVLNAFIDHHLAAHGLAEDRLALVGFSQGTMMSLHAGPRRAKALAGIVGYSGVLVDPTALAKEVVTKPPILLAFGDADPILPPARMRETDVELRALGFEVTTHVSPGMGHSIDGAGLTLGAKFLTERLA